MTTRSTTLKWSARSHRAQLAPAEGTAKTRSKTKSRKGMRSCASSKRVVATSILAYCVGRLHCKGLLLGLPEIRPKLGRHLGGLDSSEKLLRNDRKEVNNAGHITQLRISVVANLPVAIRAPIDECRCSVVRSVSVDPGQLLCGMRSVCSCSIAVLRFELHRCKS